MVELDDHVQQRRLVEVEIRDRLGQGPLDGFFRGDVLGA